MGQRTECWGTTDFTKSLLAHTNCKKKITFSSKIHKFTNHRSIFLINLLNLLFVGSKPYCKRDKKYWVVRYFISGPQTSEMSRPHFDIEWRPHKMINIFVISTKFYI